jgi:hypothetical protein
MSIEPLVIAPPVELETDPCSRPEPAWAQAVVHSSAATTKSFIWPACASTGSVDTVFARVATGHGAESEPDYSTRRRFLTGAGPLQWQDGVRRSNGRRIDPHPQTKDKETVMNYLATAALTLALSLTAGSAFAADAPAKAVTPQQQRMKDCNTQASGKHGDERKAFMSACLKGGSSTAGNPSTAATAPKHAASKSKNNPGSGKL